MDNKEQDKFHIQQRSSITLGPGAAEYNELCMSCIVKASNLIFCFCPQFRMDHTFTKYAFGICQLHRCKLLFACAHYLFSVDIEYIPVVSVRNLKALVSPLS